MNTSCYYFIIKSYCIHVIYAFSSKVSHLNHFIKPKYSSPSNPLNNRSIRPITVDLLVSPMSLAHITQKVPTTFSPKFKNLIFLPRIFTTILGRPYNGQNHVSEQKSLQKQSIYFHSKIHDGRSIPNTTSPPITISIPISKPT